MRRIDLEKATTARAQTMRDINRRIVLNYVRDRQPISRAEIARATLLQRSTVSTIVEELAGSGLIEEIGAGESSGGRRPTLLQLRAAGASAIGVDVAPTVTTIVTSDLAGRIRERREFPTSPDVEVTSRRIIEIVKSLVKGTSARHLSGIGVSVPGLVDASSGSVHYVPYFDWRDWNIGRQLKAATGLKVIVDNDANAAAMAELWFGETETSARDFMRDFIMVSIAEGVGTGIVFDGQIYRGERGAAGEFGHMIVGANAPTQCSCGNRDCWEAFASGRAAAARYQALIEASNKKLKSATAKEKRQSSVDSSVQTQLVEHDRTSEITFAELIDRALRGEAHAVTALQETARYVGIGISNLVVGLSPEFVIVGGPMVRAWHLVHEQIENAIERSVRRGLPPARIAPSSLGDQPSLMGALSLILASKFAATVAA